jgi:hypothetical protein
VSGFLSAGQPDPRKYFRFAWVFFGTGQQFNDEIVLDRWATLGMDLQLPNYWFIGWNVNRDFRTMDDLDTRGGPPIVEPAANSLNLFVNSDSRKTWRIGGNLGVTRDTEGGSRDRFGLFLNLQPLTQLQVSLSGNYSFGDTIAQWISNVDVTGDDVEDHVYGTLQRDVLDVTGRVTYAFTRNLTLQMFLQPFVAVGAYSNIRRLARPRSFDFAPAELSNNPDSTPNRCAAIRCCGGNIVPAAPSSWSGIAQAATRREPGCSGRSAISALHFPPTAITCSW